MRDARITTIYEGTTGIQANDRPQAAREGGRTLKALLAASTAMRAGWSNRPMQCWRRSAARWQPLPRRWTKRPTGCWPTTVNPRSAQRAPCPFLRLAGTVIGGWLSARMAEAATAQLAAGAAMRALGTKRATASHYAAHVLVQAPMLRDIVTGGAASTLPWRTINSE